MKYDVRGTPKDDARNDAMYARRQTGEPLASLARAYGISTKRVREILHHAHHRHQMRALGVTTRAWNVLRNSGVLRPAETPDTFTRDALIARLQTVALETIGAHHNCGVATVHELAALVGCPDRFKQRGTGVVRVRV